MPKYKVLARQHEADQVTSFEISAKNVTEARELCFNSGFIDPIVFTERKRITPAQAEFATKLKIIIPEDADRNDVSAMISRVQDSDPDSPNPDLIQFARNRFLIFS